MAEVSIPLVEIGNTTEETIQNLYDAYYKLARTVEHGFLTIDSTNIKELDGKSVKVKNIEAKSIITEQLIVGTNVALGTAVTASGVTTIINGVITTDFLNAVGIDAEYITGTYLTGKTIRSAPSGTRMQISGAGCGGYFGESKHGPHLDAAGNAYLRMFYVGTEMGNISAQSSFMSISSSYPISIATSAGITIQSSSGQPIGFFGVSPVVKQSAALLSTPGSYSYTAAATYTTNEQGMLNAAKQDINDLKNKVNGVIEKLGLYGLFTVT